MKIGNNQIGPGHSTYIIAELSANHNGDFDIAAESIKAIANTGVNAVKIQSYTPDSITLDSDKSWFRTREDSPWAGQRLYDVYKLGQTPWEWHKPLKELTESFGLDFFSSPFDLPFVDKLESIDVPAYKIASLELTHIPLIRRVAKTGKPIIMSTGAAEAQDIELALKTCYDEGNHDVALLKCTSAYPTPLEEVNLMAIKTMAEKYGVIIGLSDHTLGHSAPLGAVAIGANIIEKHFILNKELDGLDKDFSLVPEEFADLVTQVRNMEKALGNRDIDLSARMKNAKKFTRSMFAVTDILPGQEVTASMLGILRPGLGLHPKHFDEVTGKVAAQRIERGTPISWDLFK
ncbi:MAG: pseudaminic acid synthase [Roseivirga sp.]